MSSQRKPSIVFVHGLWADGSCFSKLIPTLQREGFEVIASQHGLDSHAGDVDTVLDMMARDRPPLHDAIFCRARHVRPDAVSLSLESHASR